MNDERRRGAAAAATDPDDSTSIIDDFVFTVTVVDGIESFESVAGRVADPATGRAKVAGWIKWVRQEKSTLPTTTLLLAMVS
jgi:hypothetical protein